MAKNASKSRKYAKVSDQLRNIVETCGISRYRIAQDTGIPESGLSFFLSGKRGLSSKALDVLGEYLDLEVVMHSPKAILSHSEQRSRTRR